jgi:isopentenyl-diphosphate delta-isomerase
MSDDELLILVDDYDTVIGSGAKLDVHLRGLKHRAFSVFIWNGKGELLIQQRATGKYHSSGLWANSCCGHPRDGEHVAAAARRRTQEEIGLSAELQPCGTFSYRAELPNGLIEHEYVHFFAGLCASRPRPNPCEVRALRWISPHDLLIEHARKPDQFAAWFGLYLTEVCDRILEPPSPGAPASAT